MSAMMVTRWRTIVSASSDRCALRRNWKSGPPKTSEKSLGSKPKPPPDADVGLLIGTLDVGAKLMPPLSPRESVARVPCARSAARHVHQGATASSYSRHIGG
jgi:hypothetical protein